MDWLDNSNDIGLGTSFYRPYYKSYEPMFSRFKPRSNLFNPTGSLDMFDLDDLALEVEADTILSTRYKPNLFSQPEPYMPSYYQNTSLLQDTYNTVENDNYFLRNLKTSQMPLQLPNPAKNIQPVKNLNYDNNNFIERNKKLVIGEKNYSNQYLDKKTTNQPQQQGLNYRSYTPNTIPQQTNHNNTQRINQPKPFLATPPITNIQPHNNFQQRFIQYQQRVTQQQQNKNDYENLKYRQLSDRQQQLNNKNNFTYQELLPNEFKHKQYSETSIPSTNADPLNSNTPTPPIYNNQLINKNKNSTINNNNNKKNYVVAKKLPLNNQKFYNEDEGSYLIALKEARERDKRVTKDKYTSNDYKAFQKNYGLGPNFLQNESETKEEKLEKARKREEYAKKVTNRNKNQLLSKQVYNTYEPLPTRRTTNNTNSNYQSNFDTSRKTKI